MGENSRIHSPKKRMTTLLQAAQLGNVAKVCREAGISRSTYYDWKKRFREQGKAGLVPLPTVHHAHPQTTAKHTEDQIMSLALAHPALGCDRIRDLMPDDGNMISSTTVQKILNRHGLGNRSDRWLALEKLALDHPDALTDEQRQFVSSQNPCFPKCNVKSQGLGRALVAGSWRIHVPKSQLNLLLISVLDTWTGYAFCTVVAEEEKKTALRKLNQNIARFYSGWGRKVQVIYVFSGMEANDNGILSYSENHVLIKWFLDPTVIKRNHSSCCLKRFQRIATEEYFNKLFFTQLNSDTSTCDKGFQKWLQSYNVERKHNGFPHYSRTPLHRFNMLSRKSFKKRVPKKSHQNSRLRGQLDTSAPEHSNARSNLRHSGHRTCNLLRIFMNRLPENEVLPKIHQAEPNDFFWFFCNRSRLTAQRCYT